VRTPLSGAYSSATVAPAETPTRKATQYPFALITSPLTSSYSLLYRRLSSLLWLCPRMNLIASTALAAAIFTAPPAPAHAQTLSRTCCYPAAPCWCSAATDDSSPAGESRSEEHTLRHAETRTATAAQSLPPTPGERDSHPTQSCPGTPPPAPAAAPQSPPSNVPHNSESPAAWACRRAARTAPQIRSTHQHPRPWIAEARHRPRPIRLIDERSPPGLADRRAVAAQPRTQFAADDRLSHRVRRTQDVKHLAFFHRHRERDGATRHATR